MSSITQIIEAGGGEATVGDLWPVAYGELKRLAHQRLRDVGPITVVDTTAVVNEAWLKLSAARPMRVEGRGAFLAYASKVMRSVIVDLVRERFAERRGGDQVRVTLDTGIADASHGDEPLRLDEALTSLQAVEPRVAQVVEMRCFGGLTEVEVAGALGITERTVRRDWEKARALLRTMLA